MHTYLVQLRISWGNKMNFSFYVNMSGFAKRFTIICDQADCHLTTNLIGVESCMAQV